jgi:hypothetical protein
MTRTVALSVSILLVGAVPALAQTHHPPHDQRHQHDQSHVRPDPATHAALHALFHGTWQGLSSSSDGVSGKLNLAVANDDHGKMTLALNTDQLRPGAASDIGFDGEALRWKQDVSGTACSASATVSAAAGEPETMKGTMTCGRDAITFKLQKTKG